MLAQVGIGEHRAHAGIRASSGRVDVKQTCVRMRTATERAVQEARQLDVVGEAPLPAQQRLVLDALDPLTEERRRSHGFPLFAGESALAEAVVVDNSGARPTGGSRHRWSLL